VALATTSCASPPPPVLHVDSHIRSRRRPPNMTGLAANATVSGSRQSGHTPILILSVTCPDSQAGHHWQSTRHGSAAGGALRQVLATLQAIRLAADTLAQHSLLVTSLGPTS
jgi:hypothetical protein